MIGENVCIGEDVRLITGSHDEGAIVAAGAVVTKDVEPWSVVAGNPAKFIKKRALRDETIA